MTWKCVWKLVLLYCGISLVQSLSYFRLFATPWTAACQASLSITNSQSLLKLMSIQSVIPANHLILCHPLLLLPSIFPSIRVFSSESVLHIKWPKYWSFSFSISTSNEYSGLISFRIDWFDLLAVQGTLKSPMGSPTPQFKSTNSSAFSFLYGPTIVEYKFMIISIDLHMVEKTFKMFQYIILLWNICLNLEWPENFFL